MNVSCSYAVFSDGSGLMWSSFIFFSLRFFRRDGLTVLDWVFWIRPLTLLAEFLRDFGC